MRESNDTWTVIVVGEDGILAEQVFACVPEGSTVHPVRPEALDRVAALPRRPDVALIDASLPEEALLSALSELRDRMPACIPVGAVPPDDATAVQTLAKLGIHTVVPRPMQRDILADALSCAVALSRLRTERTSGRAEDRDSETLLRVMVEDARLWEGWLGTHGEWLYVSPACERITGYPPDEFTRNPKFLQRIVHPDDRPIVQNRLFDDLAAPEPVHFEFRVSTRNGEERHIAHDSHSVFAPDGAWIGRRVTHTEISDSARGHEEADYGSHLISTALDAIISTDLDFRIVSWNQAAESIYGWTEEETKGQNLLDFLNTRFLDPSVLRPKAQVLEEGAWQGEVVQRCRDGHDIDVLASAAILRGHSGTPLGIVAVGRDITERKRTEEALKDSEARLRLIMEQVPAQLWTVDRNLCYTSWSGSIGRSLGVTAEQIVGRPMTELMDAFSLTEPLDELHRRTFTGESITYEAERKGRLFRVFLEPLRDGEQNVVGGIGMAWDITEARQAEEALRASEERFRGILEHSRDVAYKLDLRTGQYEYISPSALLHTGFTAEEIMQMGAAGFKARIHTSDLQNIYSMYDDEAMSPNTIAVAPVLEYRFLCKDGQSRWLTDSFTVLRDEGGQPVFEVGSLRDITERRTAEETRMLLASIVESTGDAIVSTSLSGDIITSNPAAESILGFPAGEMRGRPLSDFAAPEDRERLAGLVAEAAAGHAVQPTEVMLRCREGRTIHAWLTISPVRNANAEVVGACVIARDITERRRNEKALRESEEQFRAQYEAHPIPILTWQRRDSDFVLLAFNPAAGEATQGKLSTALGKTVDEVYPDIPQIVMDVRACFDTHAEVRREMVYQRHTSRQPVCAVFTYAFVPPDLVMMHTEDITERKRAEEALEKTNEHLRQVIDLVPHFIFAKDRQGRFIMANKAWAAVHGMEPREIVGRLHAEVGMDAADVHRRLADDNRVIESGQPLFIAEEPLRDNEGRLRWMQTTKVPLDHEGRPAVLVVAVDITERKRAEEERENFQEQMLQTQKLESLGVLAGGVAHDFNNVLMAILGYADLALLDMPAEASGRGCIEEICKATRRAADLSSQMLAYSGQGAFLVERLQLSRIVREMTNLLDASVAKRVVLRCELADHLPEIEADVAQLRQVVMNLTTNASEAIGEQGGLVVLRTGVMHADRDYLADTFLDAGLPEGDYVFLEVSDTGAGMAPETLKRIFDPFFTTKFAGRGLGLAAVLGIVRGHRGTIKVDSELGKGTTVRVLLPALAATAMPAGTASAAPPAMWKGQGTVLIVDDEEHALDVGQRMVERLGFNVLTARDGLEGVETFKAHADEIVCIVMDITMPILDGATALEEIRTIRSDTPVILSSGYPEQEIGARVTDRHNVVFIQKPYRLSTLAETIRTLTGPPKATA